MKPEKTPCAHAGCNRLVINKYCYWHDERNEDRRINSNK